VAQPHFSLVKWYLDCVSDAGEVAILYNMHVHWRGIRLNQSSLIATDGQWRAERASACAARIAVSGEKLSIEATHFGLHGEWSAAAAPFERVLYQSSDSVVRWNCLQPAARVRLCLAEKKLTGLGYAECLTLTVPPWKLPMRHLQWGRFVSEQDAVTWIDWRGAYSLCLANHNGTFIEEPYLSDTEVALGFTTLRLSEPLSLREGRLASTILPGAPALARIFPRSIFNVEERKWRSRGTLDGASHRSQGWVIHEDVEWCAR